MSKLEILTDEPSWTIAPKAAFCVKTSQISDNSSSKVFINVCLSDELPGPKELITEQQLAQILESDDPGSYKIPISLGDPHDEFDRKGTPCVAYDVIVNGKFYDRAVKSSELFQTFVVVVAMDAICDKYRIELDRQNWITLKNKKQMGELKHQRIRQKPKPLIEEIGDFPSSSGSNLDEELDKSELDKNKINQNPIEYEMWKDRARHTTCLMGEFRFRDPVESADVIQLFASLQRIFVDIPSQKQSVDLYIPYQINVDDTIAQFSVENQTLFVKFPLLKPL